MEWTPERIALFRKHLGDTAKQFAERMGVSRYQTVYEWEQGATKTSGTTQRLLDCLADAHGFTEGIARKLAQRSQ